MLSLVESEKEEKTHIRKMKRPHRDSNRVFEYRLGGGGIKLYIKKKIKRTTALNYQLNVGQPT